MNAGVAVRPARDEEAGEVARLINAINSLDPPSSPVAMTAEIVRRDLLGPHPRALLLVATVDGVVAGFVTGGPIYDAERAADAFMLLDLYVVPEARRRGAGRALMAALAAEAHRRGAQCLWWGVDFGDDEALLFYRAIGAEDEGPFHSRILKERSYHRLAAEAAGP